MTRANSTATAGDGSPIATHLVDGKELPLVIVADESGHIQQTLPSYSFFLKAQAGAANKDHFDLFNASGSGKLLELRGLWAMPSLIAAVTGTISPDFDFIRTSAVGTGGSAVGYKQTSFPSISPMDTANDNLPSQVTMRQGPTGGATPAEALFTAYVTQEETQAGGQLMQWFNLLPETAMGQRYAAREGQGFKLRQITAGVAQNFSFFGVFTLV
ncbi:MAG TPA: hypothetical protein VNH53_03800 [Sphingomicrobium sp.]|nr:hypothetical protein [Sphingomicrobium sp.]